MKLEERLAKANSLLEALKQNESDIAAGVKPRNDIGQKNFTVASVAAYRDFVTGMIGREHNIDAPTAGASMKEMVTSTDTIQMMPRIIEGKMIEAAEPVYLATNFFNTIQVPNGSGAVVVVPVIGEIFVKEVGEGEPFNEDAWDQSMIEKTYINIAIKKCGIRVSITEEAIADYTWDIYSMTIAKFGRAFARFKEEKCMNEFTKHGHPVFNNDPNVVAQDPANQTSGRGKDGKRNNTLSVEDFLDLILAGITNDHTPTDCIMHPLTWVIFARNSMIGAGMTWGALGGQDVHPFGGTQGSGAIGGSTQNNMGNQKFIISPEQVQNRLPVPLTMNLSPFVPFDKEKRLFDMYVLDRNNVGVIAQKSGIKMDKWSDPERDLQMVKASERYGVGISDNGRGIMVARNLAVDVTYPESIPVHVIAEN